MALEESVIAAVTNENFKVGAGGPSFWANMMYSDAISHKRHMDGLRENNFAAHSKDTHQIDLGQSLAIKEATTSNALAERTANQGTVTAALQIIAAIANRSAGGGDTAG